MQKWEYKTVVLYDDMLSEEEANLLENEGWELVAATRDYAYFKRPFNVKREFEGLQALISAEGKPSYIIGKDEEESE